MLAALKTNTTVSVLDKRGAPVSGLESLTALKLPASAEIIATRDIPAGEAFEFYFRTVPDLTQYQFLKEGDVKYRIVGVSKYDTPRGSHTEVQAERIAGTQ